MKFRTWPHARSRADGGNTWHTGLYRRSFCSSGTGNFLGEKVNHLSDSDWLSFRQAYVSVLWLVLDSEVGRVLSLSLFSRSLIIYFLNQTASTAHCRNRTESIWTSRVWLCVFEMDVRFLPVFISILLQSVTEGSRIKTGNVFTAGIRLPQVCASEYVCHRRGQQSSRLQIAL